MRSWRNKEQARGGRARCTVRPVRTTRPASLTGAPAFTATRRRRQRAHQRAAPTNACAAAPPPARSSPPCALCRYLHSRQQRALWRDLHSRQRRVWVIIKRRRKTIPVKPSAWYSPFLFFLWLALCLFHPSYASSLFASLASPG